MNNKYTINTTQNVSINYKIAGIGDRLIALIFDYLILTGISIGLSLLKPMIGTDKGGVIIVGAIIGIITFFYHFILELIFNGQSFGKKIRNLQVINKNGGEANIGNYLIRNLLRTIDVMFFIGIIFIFFSKKYQRLGDLAGSTIVVKIDKNAQLDQLAYSSIDSGYQPVYEKLEVTKLETKDIELIKEIVNRPTEAMRWDYIGLITEKTKKKMNIEFSKDSNNLEFLQSIIKDYNYYLIS